MPLAETPDSLVLGTPDDAKWHWVSFEKLYSLVPGDADEHISYYTRDKLVRVMAERGLPFETERYIMRRELIMAFRKIISDNRRNQLKSTIAYVTKRGR